MEYMQPFGFQAVRCFVAVIGLIPIIAIMDCFHKDGRSYIKRWADPNLWKAGILCGIPLFLACNLQQVALIDTDAGKAGFLTAMYIIFVPILGIFFKEKPGKIIPISVLIATVGLYFLSCSNGFQIGSGDLLLLGCALMFSVQISFVGKFASKVDALRLNAIQALVCSILSAVVMFFGETPPTLQDISTCALSMIHTGLFSMGIAYGLQIIGQKNLKPSAASLLLSLESVFAAIFGILFLQEKMTGKEIFGCFLIFAAVILSQITPKQKVK